MPNNSRQELIRKISELKVWRSGGERAPHKPLLILLALSRVAAKEPRLAPFNEIEPTLNKLLKEFGPPRKSHHPEYPFWRLQRDGLWEVVSEGPLTRRMSNTDPTRTELRSKGAEGGFTQEVYDQFRRDPRLSAEAVKMLLDNNFPTSIHHDLLGELGLSLKAVGRQPRDPRFRSDVLRAYERRCAVCGFDLRVGNEEFGLEAAHIKWHQAGGPDDVENGLALCTLHHKALDRGVIGVSEQMIILVSVDLNGSSWAKEWFDSFHGKTIRTPALPVWRPNVTFVKWHLLQVFRHPAKE